MLKNVLRYADTAEDGADHSRYATDDSYVYFLATAQQPIGL